MFVGGGTTGNGGPATDGHGRDPVAEHRGVKPAVLFCIKNN